MLAVPDRLAYAVTPEATIFLDIGNDRYFRLPPALEPPFRAALTGATLTVDALERLQRLGVLEARPELTGAQRRMVGPVAMSAVDSQDAQARIGAAVALSAALSLCRAQALLRRGFAEALAALRDRPARLAASRSPDAVQSASLAFVSARRFVPMQPICLRDSLALLDFLNRRSLDADLVFGVLARPFSAHCWLQLGGLALNDELDNLSGRTPILVI